MTTITVKVPENKSDLIYNFLKELPFAEVRRHSVAKEKILNDLKSSLEELKQYERGEIEGISMEELLEEL